MDIDNDINKTWENLLEGSESIDQCVHRLQRIAILYERCGKDGHQHEWNSTDSQIWIERQKVCDTKRGDHSHRKSKRPPKPDDDEYISKKLNLGPGTSKDIWEKYENGKLTKGELRDRCHGSKPRIKGSSKHYDPRIDVASTKPSECNKELQKLLKDILPDNYGSIKRHKADYVSDAQSYSSEKGVDERHISNGIDTLIKQINNQGKNIRKLANDFSCYSGEEFVHHPLHQHNNNVSNICNELDIITNNLCQEIEFVTELFVPPCTVQDKLCNICSYILNTTIPSLNTLTMKIRSNIIIMQHGFFSKPHAVAIVTKYEKHSKERASIIKHMINDKRVPNRSALDKVLKMEKNNQIIVDDMWHTRETSWMIKLDCKFVEERITSITDSSAHVEHYRTKMVKKIRGQRYPHYKQTTYHYKPAWEDWKDILVEGLETTTTPEEAIKYVDSLPSGKRASVFGAVLGNMDIVKEIVAKQNELSKEVESERIKMNKLKEKFNQIGSLILSVRTVTMRPDWTPNITTELYAPPIPTQISNTIGLTGNRLYFSPRQFPVTNVDTAGDSEAFEQLKYYIKHQSSLVGDSPLVFHGTDSGSKRFICKYALKSHWKEQFGAQTPFKRCAFAIVVKWDKYGFYINSSNPNPLHNRVTTKSGCRTKLEDIIQRKCVIGCECHCHPTTSDDKKLSRK